MPNALETFAESLTDADRAILHGSLTFTLELVANADSDRDRKEAQAIEQLRESARERLGAAFAAPAADFPDALAAASQFEWMQTPYLLGLAGVVRKMPAPARKLYDQVIVELALSVAGASGGFLGLGSKLSDHERYAIRRLVGSLGLVLDEPLRKAVGGFAGSP